MKDEERTLSNDARTAVSINDEELLYKFQRIIKMTSKVKMDAVADVLGLSSKDLFSKLVQWSEHLPFKIDVDMIVVDDTAKLTSALDKQFAAWDEGEMGKGTGSTTPTAAPFKAYAGTEPYIFASYAHADKDGVYPEIARLNGMGFRIWYDEGIAPSRPWAREIAEAIDKCTFFLVFISPAAVTSEYVNREITYAIDNRKHYLAIFLRETRLSKELAFLLNVRQHVFKYQLADPAFIQALVTTLPPDCKTRERVKIPLKSQDEKPEVLNEEVLTSLDSLDEEFKQLKRDIMLHERKPQKINAPPESPNVDLERVKKDIEIERQKQRLENQEAEKQGRAMDIFLKRAPSFSNPQPKEVDEKPSLSEGQVRCSGCGGIVLLQPYCNKCGTQLGGKGTPPSKKDKHAKKILSPSIDESVKYVDQSIAPKGRIYSYYIGGRNWTIHPGGS
jgi:hypothetical protein